MKYKKILITGGAGFVGSTLCLQLKKKYPQTEVIAFDNLMRRGSELNLDRFKTKGIKFIHGDVRNAEDLADINCDLLIECSAEPSVMAGVDTSPAYLIHTNLIGAINCFELARKRKADVVFLSTSRVYPVESINNLRYKEETTRFTLSENQKTSGVSNKGIAESFPLGGVRSLYGATKLAAELLLLEYVHNYAINGVVNRFGLIAGSWQMGKVDQGIIVYWMAAHIFKKPLSYIGFGGLGKQVRDVLHVSDVFSAIDTELQHMPKYKGKIYTIGGGVKNSVSLLELTAHCQKITGNKIPVYREKRTRPGDIQWYVTDATLFKKATNWKPQKTLTQTLTEIYDWIIKNKTLLEPILT